MPSIGTISITSATDFTANRSFTGTSASDDDLDITGSVAPTFNEFYLNPQGDLTYAVYAPTIARSGAYTLSWDNPNSRIEGMMRSGASSGAYNGRKIISAPGDYGQSSDPRWIFGTSGNDVMVAPLSPTGASVLYGWSGDDVLTGGDSDNFFSQARELIKSQVNVVPISTARKPAITLRIRFWMMAMTAAQVALPAGTVFRSC